MKLDHSLKINIQVTSKKNKTKPSHSKEMTLFDGKKHSINKDGPHQIGQLSLGEQDGLLCKNIFLPTKMPRRMHQLLFHLVWVWLALLSIPMVMTSKKRDSFQVFSQVMYGGAKVTQSLVPVRISLH